MKDIFLETERVILTPLDRSDVALFFNLNSDPDVMRHLSDGKPSTLAECQAMMERVFQVIDRHQYRYGLWPAYTKHEGEFMGWFLFRPGKKTPDDLRNIEVGYRLKKKFWGQGFATEVSRALVDFGFRNYDIDSVFATTMLANTGSQNVMKKLGMSKVCDYIEDDFPGANKAAVKYAIARSEWKK